MHTTSIGLDVHARSITAAAFNPFTGEIATRKFGIDVSEIADWISDFEDPKCVYESGVTGFHLVRSLRASGIDCVVGAVSKMHKPIADRRQKNDRNDAEFLAKCLALGTISEVFVPDEETEALRDLSRALDDMRSDLVRAKMRLTHFLIRHGHVFDERTSDGRLRKNWTKAHWEWIRSISFDQPADQLAFDLYISEVRHMEKHKKLIEGEIARHARSERWRGRVDALRCLKGMETVTAFAIVVEACVFSRFRTASEFASWLGLVPSDHSSGEKVAKGGITKTGNSHIRRLVIEAAWHYVNASPERKEAPRGSAVPLRIENHAAKGVRRLVARRRQLHERGKKPVVANCAMARELACWIWAIGCMCEGTL